MSFGSRSPEGSGGLGNIPRSSGELGALPEYSLSPEELPSLFTNLADAQDPNMQQIPGISGETLHLEQNGFSQKHTDQSSPEGAPLAVVRSSDVVQQIPLVNTSDDTEYLHYKELLQAFDEKTQRWQSVISIPELLIDQNLEGDFHVESYAIWQFDRKYPSATPRIFDNATRRRLEDDEVRVKAQMLDSLGQYTFSVEVRGRRNQAFIDPYNNEHLNSLELLVNKEHWLPLDHPELENPFAYSVIVIGRYQPYTSDIYSSEGQIKRAIRFRVDNLSGDLDLKTDLGREALRYTYPEQHIPKLTEALSVDHAEALLQFMDAIIPLSTLTQIPERRTPQIENQPSE